MHFRFLYFSPGFTNIVHSIPEFLQCRSTFLTVCPDGLTDYSSHMPRPCRGWSVGLVDRQCHCVIAQRFVRQLHMKAWIQHMKDGLRDDNLQCTKVESPLVLSNILYKNFSVVATRPTYFVASYVEGSQCFPLDQPQMASYTSFSVFTSRPSYSVTATRVCVFSCMVWLKL